MTGASPSLAAANVLAHERPELLQVQRGAVLAVPEEVEPAHAHLTEVTRGNLSNRILWWCCPPRYRGRQNATGACRCARGGAHLPRLRFLENRDGICGVGFGFW